MQSKETIGWFCDLLVNRHKDFIISIDVYFLLIKYLFAVVIFNNIGNFASCQAQTLENFDEATIEINNPILSSPKQNLPLTISVDNLFTTDTQVDKEQLPNNHFAFSDRSIKVKKIDVSGNTLFQSEIERLTKPFTDKSTNLGELYKLRSAISQLYTDKGYVNSGAYLPPQKLQDGVVEIKVLEGGIETVEVTGNKHLNDKYIASRLASIPTPIQADKLLEQLQLLRLDPLIKNVSAELSAGLSPGMSRLDINVEEADNFILSSSLNNHNSPSIGSNSRNLSLAHNSLFGFGDRASLNYTNTEGNNGFDFGYGFPINAKNGRINLAYGFNSNDIVEAPFTPWI